MFCLIFPCNDKFLEQRLILISLKSFFSPNNYCVSVLSPESSIMPFRQPMFLSQTLHKIGKDTFCLGICKLGWTRLWGWRVHLLQWALGNAGVAESLYWTPGTNKTLCGNYTGIKTKRFKRWLCKLIMAIHIVNHGFRNFSMTLQDNTTISKMQNTKLHVNMILVL